MSFDTLAPHYRWMERVLAGRKLQQCRLEFLGKLNAPQRALLVGEGNGRFLAEFVKRFPRAQTICLDASDRMLVEAKIAIERAGLPSGSIRFVHANIFDWKTPPEKFDLIVTNFFLDCFDGNQLARVVSVLADAVAQNAIWLLADFCQPPRGLRKWRARWILASMYLFFRFATKLPAKRLTAPDNFLRDHNFELVDRRFYDWGLLQSDLWKRCC